MGYFGSKATSGLCQPIIAMMPPHDTYIETHLGGGAIMKRKPAALHNIGIDLDGRALAAFDCDYPVQRVHGCAHRFLAEYDYRGSELVYSDPPYLMRTRTSGRRYRFDYGEADHVELLELLKTLPCQVMLSGYPSALYDELLGGWRSLELQVMNQGGVRTEKLWFNFVPDRVHWASRHTIESYALCYRLLVVFAAERHRVRPCQLALEQLDLQTILDFLDHLERARGNAVRTRNARLVAIKSFFRFLEFREPGYLDLAGRVRAIPQKKGEAPLIGYLDRQELQALLDAPDPHTVSGVRDRAMLRLAYNAGLRVSELVGLGLGDLKQPGLSEVHVMGKGRRERILPLWKETRSVLGAWLSVRAQVADRHLFLNAQKTAMTRRGFAKRVAVHAETAALTVPSIADRKVTPHVLRHCCAVHTLEATGDVRKVSLWLGHCNLQTTEMYLRMDTVEKLNTLSAWCPPTLRKGSFKGVHDQLLAMLGDVGAA